MTHSRWIIKNQAQKNQSPMSGTENLLKRILVNRGIKTDSEIEAFMHPSLRDLHSPLKLTDMEKAVLRIRRAVINKEKVLIYGDYDTDGVAATVILRDALQSLGLNVDYFIPHRELDGYGMQVTNVARLAKQYPLIITVDCGTTNHREIALARQMGSDVIVTDHHQVIKAQGLPPAHALINPNRPDDQYPFKKLAGAGVAFKLVHALAKLIDSRLIKFDKYLDLIGIATIGDVVSLTDENRILAKTALDRIATTKTLGLRDLMEYAGIKQKLVTGSDIAYRIVPRLNAAGRMDHANIAMDLLTTRDPNRSRELAFMLNKLNSARQNKSDEITKEAQVKICIEDTLHFIVGNEWPMGVLGLVAGKLAEKYYRPVLIGSRSKGMVRGSGRSIAEFDLVAGIARHAHILRRFGGHFGAAGFELPEENLDEFMRGLKKYAASVLDGGRLVPKIEVDAEIDPRALTIDLAERIQEMEPFGADNSEPLFVLRRLIVSDIRQLGAEGKHLRLKLKSGREIISAIGFGQGEKVKELGPGVNLDVVGRVAINEWNGSRAVEIHFEDFKVNK